ncbi:hypothetical protein PPL_01241 [Heterostelium album PN500]|uniref:RING-type domain-containing protein n=1 Tax=Heterostelium pallidum (strain ATCC 26659 / Pp 5 / PN500) TaxID=670386 RepID=D3AYI1_HETP5|nr:hypothetical protein PPL_01241 [Heterostelium album PN500]EFA86008.1 hypothetical protein PPL_01241 [Heterostelium album PN500]|eukprot:XP_020438114.1 hypothetical protein PPL_01241 [Heterostelium album PN500]
MTDIKSFFPQHQQQQQHHNHHHITLENPEDHHIYPHSIPRLFNPSTTSSNNNNNNNNNSNNNYGGLVQIESTGNGSLLSLTPSFTTSDFQKNTNNLNIINNNNNNNNNSKKDNFLPSNIGNGYLLSTHHHPINNSNNTTNNFPFFPANPNITFHLSGSGGGNSNGPNHSGHSSLLRSSTDLSSSNSSIVNNLNNIYITPSNNNNNNNNNNSNNNNTTTTSTTTSTINGNSNSPQSSTSSSNNNNNNNNNGNINNNNEINMFNYDNYLTMLTLSCIKCPDDKSYEFKCSECNNGSTFFFKHSPKTWKEMIHTSLFNLERDKNYRFSHYREVISYIRKHPQFLLSDREKETGKMKNVITATLSYNRKLFVSFARDSGMWSNWRPGDKVYEDDRGLLILLENTFEAEIKSKETYYFKLECKECTKLVSFELSELCGSSVIPGPADNRFEFTCDLCSNNKRPTLSHQSKSWKEVAHTALYNLEREKKYRFSHQIEIATYVKEHPESFAFNREIDNIKNRLSTVLSRYKKSFTSIGRYTGMWSNWRDGDENMKELECEDEESDEEVGAAAGKSTEKKNSKAISSPSASGKKRSAASNGGEASISEFTIQKSPSSTPLVKPRQIPSTPTCTSSSSSPNNFIMSPIIESPYFNSSNNNGNTNNNNNNPSLNSISNNSPKLSPDSSSTTPLLNNSPNFFYPSPNFHPNNSTSNLSSSNHPVMYPSNLFGNSLNSLSSSSSSSSSSSYKKSEGMECAYCKKTKNSLFKCSMPYCPKSFCQDCLIEYHPQLQPKPNHLNEWCCPTCITSNTGNSMQFPHTAAYSHQILPSPNTNATNANSQTNANNFILLHNTNTHQHPPPPLNHSLSFPSTNSFVIASSPTNAKGQQSSNHNNNNSNNNNYSNKSTTPKRSSSVNDMRVNGSNSNHDISLQKSILFPLDQTLYASQAPKDKRYKTSFDHQHSHSHSHSHNHLNPLGSSGGAPPEEELIFFNSQRATGNSPNGHMSSGFPPTPNHAFHPIDFNSNNSNNNNNNQSNFYNSSIPSIQFPTLNHHTFPPPHAHSQSLPAIPQLSADNHNSFTHVLNPFHNSPLSKSFSPETKITDHHNIYTLLETTKYMAP